MPVAEINVQQLYIAYYGRPADAEGLAFWTAHFSSTDNLDQALAAFGTSAEFTDRYGALSPTALVNGLYQQLFNRTAAPAGLAFYLEQLDSGTATLASIALDIANGAQNRDRTILDNKITVTSHCTDQIATSGADYGPAEIDAAQALLAGVGATVGSVRSAVIACDGGGFVVAPEPPTPTPIPTPGPIPTPVPAAVPVLLFSISDDRLVNTETTDSQADPAVAALSDGGWLVTWTSSIQDGDYGGIYGQAYNAAGTPQRTEFRVNSTTDGSQDSSAVTGLSDGSWVVTWQGVAGNLFGQRYSAAGATQGNEFQINSTVFAGLVGSSVTGLVGVAGAEGGWVATWSGLGSNPGIYGQAYNAAGMKQGNEFLVNTATTGAQTEPSVTALSDGGWVVTWESSDQDSDGTAGVYGQAYNADGTPQGSKFPVNTATADAQTEPSVAGLSNGGWVVTWQSVNQDATTDPGGIYGQAYDAAGTKDTMGEFRVNTTTANLQTKSSVTALSDGGWVVTWQSSSQDSDGSSGVYGQRYNAAGVKQGDAEFRVNTETTGTQANPSVAGLSDGGWVVTWESDTFALDTDSNGVYSKTYNAAGETGEAVYSSPLGVPVAFSAGTPAEVLLYEAISLTDSDSANLLSALITLTDAVTTDSLGLMDGYTPPAGIEQSYDSATGVLTLSGSASLADYEAALEKVVYNSTAADLGAADANRTVSAVLNDGINDSQPLDIIIDYIV